MNRLANKVAIITGAALGIGAATARRMGEEGASVALLDLHGAEGEALAAKLDAVGIKARFWACDVSKEADVKRVFGEVEHHFGRIDIVVNNAGVSGANKPTHEVTEAEWDFVQAINVKGVFFCTKYAVPAMKRAGGGSIINLSSIYGLVGAPDAPPYHASKGAVRLMSKTDAMIYAPDKIRVNSVHPGFIWTPMVEAHLKGTGHPDEAKQQTAALHPLGHLGEADDIAWGCVYLASDEAKFITGSELVIDGGYTAR